MKLFITILVLFFTAYSPAATYDYCSCKVFHQKGAHIAKAYLRGTTKEDVNGDMDIKVVDLAQFIHHDKRHYLTPEVVRSALHLCQASMAVYIKKDICPEIKNK